MKKSISILAVVFLVGITMSSCKKCKDCHYDGAAGEVELGEYCDDAVAEIEANGHYDSVADTTYEVHCSEHE